MNISKINLYGTEYDIEDTEARSDITTLETKVNSITTTNFSYDSSKKTLNITKGV